MLILSFLIATILILLYLRKLIKEKNDLFIYGFIFLFEIIWMFYSIVAVDNGIYIAELGRFTYFTGASIRLFLIYLPFLLLLPRFLRKYNNKLEQKSKKQFKLIHINVMQLEGYLQIALFFVILYGMTDMLLTGIPLFNGFLTRTNYFMYSKLPFASIIMGEVTFFLMFVNGKHCFTYPSRVNKLFSYTLLLMSLLQRILMSYKFDGVYQIVLIFFLYRMGIWFKNTNASRILSLKSMTKGILIVFLFLGICYFSYSFTNSTSDIFSLLFERIFAFQSHTWWGIDNHLRNTAGIGFNPVQLQREISALLNGAGVWDKDTGLVKVMYDVAYKITVDAYVKGGSRFYGNFVTVAVNSFGYIGTAIYSIFIAKLIAFTVANFKNAAKNAEYILLYVSMSILWDVIDYFRVGNFCILINPKTLVIFTVLLVINFIKALDTEKVSDFEKRSFT